MKQLTVEILSAYLPFKLQVRHESGPIMEMTADCKRGYFLSMASVLDGMGKPLLRPLSMITEPITHEGETFVPVKKIREMFLKIDGEHRHFDYPLTLDGRSCGTLSLPYWVIQKLIEWHFDVFNLPDNLIIAKTN